MRCFTFLFALLVLTRGIVAPALPQMRSLQRGRPLPPIGGPAR